MKVLFLTISGMPNYNRHDIYADVLHCFVDNGHEVYSISSNQKRNNKSTSLTVENGINALRVKIGNITQCGMIEKGISTLLVKYQYIKAINKYFSNIKFDLVLYATPPITLADVIKYVKKRDDAKTYLMLKDIFPQNAIDLEMLSNNGIKGILYKYFRREEKKLYAISDKIGCMSPANEKYILNNNPEIKKEKVEVFPNCIDPLDLRIDEKTKKEIRIKYDIPLDKTVFVYGGNIGKPQGVPYIIDCLNISRDKKSVFFLIVGNGTEYDKISDFLSDESIDNTRLMKRIPKEDYDCLVSACDVGLIFLDYRFTIPNFPSRLLSYLQAGLPVLCATDINTDIGRIAQENGFGWWCESNDTNSFSKLIDYIEKEDLKKMGMNGKNFLDKNYNVKDGYNKLLNFMKQ